MYHQRFYRCRNFNPREPIVEDLREKLNRKRDERDPNSEASNKNLPPPDPAYNFLKDPLRGDNCDNPKSSKGKRESKVENVAADQNSTKPVQDEKTTPRGNWNSNRRTGGWSPKPWHRIDRQQPRDPKGQDVRQQQPPKQLANNIKVEVSSTSGARKCTMDETKTVQVTLTGSKGKSNPGKWPQKHETSGKIKQSPVCTNKKSEEDVKKAAETAPLEVDKSNGNGDELINKSDEQNLQQ